MKSRIKRIGRSYFVRIPKRLLNEAGVSGEVEIRAEGNAIVLGTRRRPREGWLASFRAVIDHAVADGSDSDWGVEEESER